jgi:ABC-2 type transport system permease protein
MTETQERPAAQRRQGGDPNTTRRTPMITLFARQGVTEIKQFSRSREQVVFTLAFPAIILLIFGFIFKGHLTPEVTFTQYFVAGMIASGLLASGFQALGIQIPIERDKGVLKRFRGTPMPPAVYFAGKVAMVYVVGLVETAILLAFGVLFDGVHLPATGAKWFTLVWVMILGITACTLMGIAFSSVPRTGRSAAAVVTPVALILQFISGVFFVFTSLPGPMRQIASLFPLKWLCQGMRAVFLPDSFAVQESAGSWELGRVALVLAAWCVGGLILCRFTFRWTRRDG